MCGSADELYCAEEAFNVWITSLSTKGFLLLILYLVLNKEYLLNNIFYA